MSESIHIMSSTQQQQQPRHNQGKEEWHVSPLQVAPNAITGMNGGGRSLTPQMARPLLQSNTVGSQGDLRNNGGGSNRPLLVPPELPMRRFGSSDPVNHPADSSQSNTMSTNKSSSTSKNKLDFNS